MTSLQSHLTEESRSHIAYGLVHRITRQPVLPASSTALYCKTWELLGAYGLR